MRGVERLGGVVELTGLAGTDKLGKKITTAKVAGKSDIRESSDKARRLCGGAQIASQASASAMPALSVVRDFETGGGLI